MKHKLTHPDEFGTDRKGQPFIRNKDWRSIFLSALGQPEIRYVPVKNLYFDRGGKPLDDEKIETLPLKWKYSTGPEFEDEYKPTTKNIEAKRKELVSKALEAGANADMEKIIRDTSPTHMLEAPVHYAKFQKKIQDKESLLSDRLAKGITG